MVSLSKSFQTLLAEKDANFSAQAGKLLQSEQVRAALAQEVSRLKLELEKAHLAARDDASASSEVELLKAERERMKAELAKLRESAGSHADVAELQRRLDETLRAKDFFEAKVKQLEAGTSGSADEVRE